MAIYVTPQEIGTHKGCTMFRQFTEEFTVNIRKESVKVLYDQWLVTSTGDIVEYVSGLQYLVTNIPAILDEEGVEITPAFNGFTTWRSYNAGATPDGTTMEAIFFTAINNQLKDIPIDTTINPHIITD